MRTDTQHRWWTVIIHRVTNKGKQNNFKHLSRLTNYGIKTSRKTREASIFVGGKKYPKNLKNFPALYRLHHESTILFVQINAAVARQQALSYNTSLDVHI